MHRPLSSALQRPTPVFLPFTATPGLSLDALKQKPIVPGVAVATEGPATGHYVMDENDQPVPEYLDAETLRTVMEAAKVFTNGIRVNVDHYSAVAEAAGFLNALRVDGVKLRGDLNLFRSYTGFEHLAEVISTVPDTFGLSLDFDRTHEFKDGKAYARATAVISCDLVSAPAANRGLFDNQARSNMSTAASPTASAPATPAAPATPSAPAAPAAPATPPSALSAEDITKIVTEALSKGLAPVLQTLTEHTQAINDLKAAPAAAAGATAETPAMKALRETILTEVGKQHQALARQLGVQLTAAAGASPVEAPAGAASGDGNGGDARKAWEIPAAERNAKALEALR